MASDQEHRTFTAAPLPAFIEQVRAQLMEHGQPELIDDLFHDHIDKDEYFEILAEVDIDPLKRPEADLAPCPMCQPNKFLHGRLCYFPGLECCAIIGHCCANKEHSAAAERRFKEASVLKWQEDYFLDAMPLVEEKLRILGVMAVKAEEAQRLHRKFRKDANQLMMLLRDSTRGESRLQVHYEIKRVAGAEAGPAGFRSKERVFDTIDFGELVGTVAIRAKYDPLEEVEAMLASLQVWNVGTDEGVIIDAITTMNERQRQRGYAVLTDIDHKKWPQFARKIEDFTDFFEPENLRRLNDWGTDPRNPTSVRVTDHKANHGLRQVEIAGASTLTRMSPHDHLFIPVPDWPAVPKRK